MAHKWHISRRTALRGLGAAVSLPLLDVMSAPALNAADNVTPTTRAAYLYFPNGVADGAWHPEKIGSDGEILKLNRWAQSLEPLRSELIFFRNMWTPRGNGHIAGTATWLTGGSYDAQRIDAGGASVDQLVAKHFANQTLLPSLDLSVRGEGFFSSSLPRNTLSWVDARTPAPRDIEPRVVFDRMFRAGQSGLSDRSVLDLVLSDAKRLQGRISRDDKRKVDEYLDSVRAIERRIEFAETQTKRANANTKLQNALVRPDEGIPEDHGEYMRTMLDMIVLAFWADATRVSTMMLDHGQSNRYFNFIDGVQGTWHALSHWRDASGKTEDDDGITSWGTREEKRKQYNRVTQWHTEQVAYFLKRLHEIQEPTGSLLDNSMIVYGSNLADGHAHAEKNLPIMLAGRGGSKINAGRQIGSRRDTSMSDLHLAILHHLGIDNSRFADSDSPITLS
ncbi:MAG: DUF1552 domain-containing protein [Planctomycetota bacterium]